MKDKEGNELTGKEYMERWKEGVRNITPLQQAKISIVGVLLMLVGIVIGLVVTFISETWWLFIILLGSLVLTKMNLLATWQRIDALQRLEGGMIDE